MDEFVTQISVGPGYIAESPQASGLRNPDPWLLDALTWGPSEAGVRVNQRTALSHVPVWQAINILAGDVGQLPIHKMVRRGKQIEKDRKHPAEFVLNHQPNELQTPSMWKETMMAWALGWGNGISWYEKIGLRSYRLVPLPPEHTSWEDRPGMGIHITTRLNDEDVAFPYEECFHLRGLTTDGFWGLSAVQTCKNAIGHGIALRQHGNATFKNGARPSGVVSFPPDVDLNVEAKKNFRKEWEALHAGVSNNRPAILWDGAQWSSISMSNEDAQWLESVSLDREIVASIFNLPAFKLNALKDSAVRSNLEQQNRDYFNTSLSRWTNRFSEEGKRVFLLPNERNNSDHFFRWFPEAFLRGDLKSRSEAYGLAKSGRWMTANEIREKEDMNPIDGGDELDNPAIDVVQKQPEPPPANANSKQAIEALLLDQAAKLLRAESEQAKRAAKNSGKFNRWLEGYEERFTGLAKEYMSASCLAASAMGVVCDWRFAARMHSSTSCQALTLITDGSNAKDLSAAVAEFAESNERTTQNLIDQILGAQTNVA